METTFHIVIPLLLLLVFFPKLEKKYIFGLLFLTILPDFDYVINVDLHRFLFHNIFFVIIITLMVWGLWNKRAAIVGGFYLFSHLLLDFANNGPVALFWPFYNKLYLVNFNLKYFGGFKFKVYWDYMVVHASQLTMTHGGDLLTTNGLIILGLLMIVGIVYCYNSLVKQ